MAQADVDRLAARAIRASTWLALLALSASGCTFFQRALTWPSLDPFLDVGWYEPCDPVPGDPDLALPVAEPDQVEIPAEALSALATYAEQRNSCALLVLHRGRIVLERYWCGMDRDSRINAWSMSKTVVALALGAAVGQGWIPGVELPISTWIPEWAGDERGQITVRDLLQMTSGLRVGNMIRIHIGTDARSAILDTDLVEPPGKAFRYSNVNTMLLTMVLQRATGRRYAEFLSESLWRPLGADPAAVWLDVPGGLAKTYCCLLTTARDWARVGQLMLERGRVAGAQVVPEEWIEHMLTPSEHEENYGYHVWLGYSRPASRQKDWSVPFASPDSFMLVGRDEQRVYVVPVHQLVIVRLGHAAPGWDDPTPPNLLIDALRRQSGQLDPARKKTRQSSSVSQGYGGRHRTGSRIARRIWVSMTTRCPFRARNRPRKVYTG